MAATWAASGDRALLAEGAGPWSWIWMGRDDLCSVVSQAKLQTLQTNAKGSGVPSDIGFRGLEQEGQAVPCPSPLRCTSCQKRVKKTGSSVRRRKGMLIRHRPQASQTQKTPYSVFFWIKPWLHSGQVYMNPP